MFAITAKDGARQYAYCRPLSSSHSLVLLSSLAHTSVYVSALERTAAQYAYMADDVSCFPKRRRHLDPESLGPCSSGHPSHSLFNSSLFLNSDVMRCLPRVARHLCKSLLEWLNNPFPDSSRDFVAGSLKRRAEHAPEHYDLDKENGDPTTDPEGSSAPCLTSSTTSSGLLANVVKDCSTEKDYRSLWRKEREMNSRMTNGGGRSAFSLPWEIELNSEDTSPVSVARIIELGDATLLFRHFSIRSLLSIVVAVLEERRLCIVGPSTALVSRAVLAVDNLLRPFEWPHLMSPILLEHMLPVLGAPFPFMVGILEDHFPQTKDLPLDDVVFADLHTGKVTSTSDLGDFSRRIPRRIRYRFEKRLTRAKAACMRQIYRSRSTPFVPVVSNTATSFFEGDPFDDGPQDKRPGLLWRSKSQQKIAYEPLQQNIWLARETVTMLDKGMRKFFSGLLENFTAFRLEDAAMADGYNRLDSLPRSAPLPSSSMSFGSRRETDRRQLARAFCATQMFMQWEDSEGCDVTFGLIPVESMLKRRGSLCEQSLTSRRTNVEDLEYPTRMSYARQPGTSDGECARYDASVFSGDSSLRRKRFGGKRKNRHSSVKRHFNSDAEDLPMESRSIFSDAESNYRPVRPTTEPNITPALDRTLSTVCEPDWDVGTAPKRLWLSLRLPSSNWSLGRDLGMFTYKDDGEDLAEEEGQSGATEMLDGSSDGNETEDLVESNHRNDRGEVFPVEEVGATWNLVCAWNRRRGKQSRI